MQGAVGAFPKDKFKGKFVDEWNTFLQESKTELETKDVGPAFAGILAVKDEEEVVSDGHSHFIPGLLEFGFNADNAT